MAPNLDSNNTETIERITSIVSCDQSGETLRAAPTRPCWSNYQVIFMMAFLLLYKNCIRIPFFFSFLFKFRNLTKVQTSLKRSICI